MIKKLSVCVVVICLSLVLVYNNHKSAVKLNATVLPKARTLTTFKLTDTNNQLFTQHSLQNRWTLLFFGFTHCSAVCPVTMSALAQMYRILEKKHVADLPHVVMITLDPKRDDLKHLREYVTAFNPHFDGVTGKIETIHSLAKLMGVAYTNSVANGDIEHTGTIMLINPQGKLLAFFTSLHDPKILAHDYLEIL